MGAIDNTNRNFRLEASYQRDRATLEKFIRMKIEEGNHIITDSWLGYNFMNSPNSGYIHISHNHRNGIFGLGTQTTAHIEGLSSILKGKIKSAYNVISTKNIIHFIHEAELKLKIEKKIILIYLRNFSLLWLYRKFWS